MATSSPGISKVQDLSVGGGGGLSLPENGLRAASVEALPAAAPVIGGTGGRQLPLPRLWDRVRAQGVVQVPRRFRLSLMDHSGNCLMVNPVVAAFLARLTPCVSVRSLGSIPKPACGWEPRSRALLPGTGEVDFCCVGAK